MGIAYFIFLYALSYLFCIAGSIFGAKSNDKRLKLNIVIETVLFLKPCRDWQGKMPYHSLLHQIVSQCALIIFLVMYLPNPEEKYMMLRYPLSILFSTWPISFLGSFISYKRGGEKEKREYNRERL